MEQNIKQIRKTLGLLSSMVYSGEKHSNSSEKAVNRAINALDRVEVFIQNQ